MQRENETIALWSKVNQHKFTFEGVEANIIAPEETLPGKPCFWIPEWLTAFPDRNGARRLLSLGYTLIHINVWGYYANPEGVEIMHKFHEHIVSLGYPPRISLIGMSLGGLYSFRYAETYPEEIACIYADAPVCNLMLRNCCGNSNDATQDFIEKYKIAYKADSIENHPLSPINNMQRMAENKIPVLMILGDADTVVTPETNGLLFAERYAKAGGPIEVIRRPSWGHHPHGLDNPDKIVRFIVAHTLCR